MSRASLYDDGLVLLDEEAVTLRRYYFPTGGGKRIPYRDIRRVEGRPMGWLNGKGRVWGTGNPGFWFPLDPGRARRDTLVLLDLGRRVKPAFTPDDPDYVIDIIQQHMAQP